MTPGVVYHPRAVHARISSGCNLSCNFCERELLGPGKRKTPGIVMFNDGRPPLDLSKDMDDAVWDRICERLMPFTENMELGGLGEPTLAKLFPRAARDVIEAGKNLFFFTNGHTLGAPRTIEAVQGGSVRISISLDAGTASAYARIRGGDLDRVIRNVRAFRAAAPHVVLCSQFTATADNIDELPAFTELCAELGIGRRDEGGEIIVAPAHHHVTDRPTKSVRFAERRTREALDQAVKIAQRERLWLLSTLPEFSTAAPNAIDDDSDPTLIRRYSDVLLTQTCDLSSAPPPDPEPPPTFGAQRIQRTDDRAIRYAPQQLYVDHTGECWTCLARHVIGSVMESGWEELVDRNEWYQRHLAFFAGAPVDLPKVCKSCPSLA